MKKATLLNSREYLKDTIKTFKKHGIENPRQEAEILLLEVLKINKLNLYLKDIEINLRKLKKLQALINKRLQGMPLQYLLNNAFFYGLKFKVNEKVFIPRPETEILVEATLKIIKDCNFKNPQLVDIGTGCANIAISLTKHLINCKMLATDISLASLEVARQNAKRYNLNNKITFLKGNLFEPLKGFKERIDIIISNPPYVNSGELNSLQREVKREPLLALFGGEDGLYFYERIIKEAHFFLKSSGFLIMELAKGRSQRVLKMILSDVHYKNAWVIKDYNNINRVVVTQRA